MIGAGEHIVRASLARTVCEAIQQDKDDDTHEVLRTVLIEKFWGAFESVQSYSFIFKQRKIHVSPVAKKIRTLGFYLRQKIRH